MIVSSVVLLVTGLIVAGFTLNPRTLEIRSWRATVTPLASIIGSGFLVAAPILSHIAGLWAFAAMAMLCALAIYFGAAVRHNIKHVQPILERGAAPIAVRALERASELALTLSYFVSVAYYLNLFAAFGLKGVGIVDPFYIQAVSTLIIGAVGALGLWRGLAGLERVEFWAVGLKLAIIAGLIAALLVAGGQMLASGGLALPDLKPAGGIAEMRVLLGLVILVQGFETSRYLGSAYKSKMRINTMLGAQVLASAIYVSFILLATPFFTSELPAVGGETEIVNMLAPLGALVAPMIIVMALASQLSAAVADLNGAGGLLAETSGRRLSVGVGYAVTAGAAIAITWMGNIYDIITYASKAFVIYYGLQSAQAALSAATSQNRGGMVWSLVFGVGALVAIVIVLFATPVGA